MRRLPALFLALSFLTVPALASEGDTLAVGPEKPAERELATKQRVRKESISDDDVVILDARDARLKAAAPSLPRRTGFVAAGLGFVAMPPPPVTVEERPVRGDRGFRVER